MEVPAGANATVVAHLDADGNPTLTPFVNDTSATGPGEARLTVRHTAAAPGLRSRRSGGVSGAAAVFPSQAGGFWRASDWHNWRNLPMIGEIMRKRRALAKRESALPLR